jgi:hypothetical protein
LCHRPLYHRPLYHRPLYHRHVSHGAHRLIIRGAGCQSTERAINQQLFHLPQNFEPHPC